MTVFRRGRWAALLIVLALAGCQSAGPSNPQAAPEDTSAAPAPASAPPSALFYTKAGSLYVSAPAGTPGRRLTDGPADAQPAPAPDLSRVAFVRKAAASDHGGELWVLDLSAQLEPVGAARRLVDPAALPQRTTGTPTQVIYPRWSPAGGQVAFLADMTGGMVVGGTLLVADADTGALAPRPTQPPEFAWAPFAAGTFDWAPDGSRIVWLDQRSDVRPTNVNVLTTATGQSAPLATSTNALSAIFARDGQAILFANGDAPPDFILNTGGIYSVPTSGTPGPPTALFTGKGSSLSNLAVLDSGAMAFIASVPNRPGTQKIQVLDKGASQPRTVVTDLATEPVCYTTPSGEGACYDIPTPAWDAAGLLAYLDNSPQGSLVVTDPDNRDPKKVDTGVESLAWAPRPE